MSKDKALAPVRTPAEELQIATEKFTKNQQNQKVNYENIERLFFASGMAQENGDITDEQHVENLKMITTADCSRHENAKVREKVSEAKVAVAKMLPKEKQENAPVSVIYTVRKNLEKPVVGIADIGPAMPAFYDAFHNNKADVSEIYEGIQVYKRSFTTDADAQKLKNNSLNKVYTDFVNQVEQIANPVAAIARQQAGKTYSQTHDPHAVKNKLKQNGYC